MNMNMNQNIKWLSRGWLISMALLLLYACEPDVAREELQPSLPSEGQVILEEIDALTAHLKPAEDLNARHRKNPLFLRIETGDTLLLGDLFLRTVPLGRNREVQGVLGELRLLNDSRPVPVRVRGLLLEDETIKLLALLPEGEVLVVKGKATEQLAFEGQAFLLKSNQQGTALAEPVEIKTVTDPRGDTVENEFNEFFEGFLQLEGERSFDLLATTTRRTESYFSFTFDFAEGNIELATPEGLDPLVLTEEEFDSLGGETPPFPTQEEFEQLAAEVKDQLFIEIEIGAGGSSSVPNVDRCNPASLFEEDYEGEFNVDYTITSLSAIDSRNANLLLVEEIEDDFTDVEAVAEARVLVYDNRVVIIFSLADIGNDPFQYTVGVGNFFSLAVVETDEGPLGFFVGSDSDCDANREAPVSSARISPQAKSSSDAVQRMLHRRRHTLQGAFREQ